MIAHLLATNAAAGSHSEALIAPYEVSKAIFTATVNANIEDNKTAAKIKTHAINHIKQDFKKEYLSYNEENMEGTLTIECPEGAYECESGCCVTEQADAFVKCEVGGFYDDKCWVPSKFDYGCPFGYVLDGRVCKRFDVVDAMILCPADFTYNHETKICGNMVETPGLTCPEGGEIKNGTCVTQQDLSASCPQGFELVDETDCVRVVDSGKCKEEKAKSGHLRHLREVDNGYYRYNHGNKSKRTESKSNGKHSHTLDRKVAAEKKRTSAKNADKYAGHIKTGRKDIDRHFSKLKMAEKALVDSHEAALKKEARIEKNEERAAEKAVRSDAKAVLKMAKDESAYYHKSVKEAELKTEKYAFEAYTKMNPKFKLDKSIDMNCVTVEVIGANTHTIDLAYPAVIGIISEHVVAEPTAACPAGYTNEENTCYFSDVQKETKICEGLVVGGKECMSEAIATVYCPLAWTLVGDVCEKAHDVPGTWKWIRGFECSGSGPQCSSLYEFIQTQAHAKKPEASAK